MNEKKVRILLKILKNKYFCIKNRFNKDKLTLFDLTKTNSLFRDASKSCVFDSFHHLVEVHERHPHHLATFGTAIITCVMYLYVNFFDKTGVSKTIWKWTKNIVKKPCIFVKKWTRFFFVISVSEIAVVLAKWIFDQKYR